MDKKIILHFIDEEDAHKFKENWEQFKDNMIFSSIEQKGNICVVTYNNNAKKICSPENSIFRVDCQ